jgi:hypothetical protein
MQRHATTGGAVWLGNYKRDFVAGGDHRLKGRYSELRRATKRELQTEHLKVSFC